MGTQQQFCLKWNNHQTNMLNVFEHLLCSEALVDVTLACEGLTLKAHKMVLSACSPFFQSIFIENPCQHPVVILKDMRFAELKAIVDFMYRGEVNVSQEQLSTLLKTAETLKVKGLAEVTNQDSSITENHVPLTSSESPSLNPSCQLSTDSVPLSKRKRGRPRKRSLSGSNRSDEEPPSNKLKEPSSDIEEIEEKDVTDEIERIPSSNHIYPQSSAIQENAEKSHSVLPSMHPPMNSIEEPHSGDDGDFEVEPSKLMEQTLTTDNISVYSNNSSTSHSSPKILPAPSGSACLSSESAQNVIDSQVLSHSPQEANEDVKPRALVSYEEPPLPAVIHSSDQKSGSLVFMDPSSVPAIPGPSSYSSDSQLQESSQGYPPRSRFSNNYTVSFPPEMKPSLQALACFNNSALPIVPSPGVTSKDTFCYMCGRNFSTRGSLRRHQLLHKPLRGKFHCPCCPKAFSWPGDLQTHIRCFHPDIPKSQRKYKLHFRFKQS